MGEGDRRIRKEAAEKTVGRNKIKISNPWNIIIQDIDERRKLKALKTDKGRRKYKEVRNRITGKCREEKQKWIKSKYKVTEKKF